MRVMEKKKPSLTVNSILNIMKQCCSIIFPLITFPYVSRVLGSENYGKYSVSNSIIYYFTLIGAFGISGYAIREGAKLKYDKEKWRIFANQIFSINIVTSITAIVLLILFLICNEMKIYNELLLIQGVAIIFNVLGSDWINAVFEDYKYITVRYVICQIISVVLMFALVRESTDYYKYAAIMTFASVGGNISNIFYVRRYVKLSFTLKMSWREHIQNIVYFFFNTLAIAVYVNSDIVILGYLRTESEVGLYTLAGRIYGLVKMLINAVITVSIPRVAYLSVQDPKKYLELSNKVLMALGTVLLPACVGLFCLSEEAMYIVGGTEYIGASITLKILCIAMFFAIGASFFSNIVLIVFNREKNVLLTTSIAAVLNIILNFGIIRLYGMEGAAITTVIAEFTYCILVCWSSRKYWNLRCSRKWIFVSIGGCLGIIVNCYLWNQIIINRWLFTIIAVATSTILYVVVLIIFKHPLLSLLVKHGCRRGK